MILFLIILLIFSNQYLLLNEELFIILAFFALCFFVKKYLGLIISNELEDRKSKILKSYLEFLEKKSFSLRENKNSILKKIEYLNNTTKIQNQYFEKFMDLIFNSKTQELVLSNKKLESNYLSYFAILVANKRKFL